MSCLFFIVFIIPVGAQKDSDRDGIRTHERKAYWNSSPTPWPLGHPIAIFWEKPEIAVYSAPVFFLVLPDISNILNELECAHICLLFFRTFLNQMFSRHWVCCSEWGACNSACLSFASLPSPKGFRQRWDSNPRTETVLDYQSNVLTTRPPCRYLLTKAKNCCLFCISFSLLYQICPTSSN